MTAQRLTDELAASTYGNQVSFCISDRGFYTHRCPVDSDLIISKATALALRDWLLEQFPLAPGEK